jgi:hypothetical protein
MECNNFDTSYPHPDGGFVWETIGSGALCKRYTLQEPFHATEAPKILFYCIEQCQEIMTLGKLPYTM